MFHDDENRALGMSYLNYFTICEDDQFECSGVFEVDSESINNATFYCNIGLEQTTANYFEANEGFSNLKSCYLYFKKVLKTTVSKNRITSRIPESFIGFLPLLNCH